MIQLEQTDNVQTFWVHLRGQEGLPALSTLTFVNQLSLEESVLTPLSATGTGRATTITCRIQSGDLEDFPEGTYILTISESGTTYATRLCYISGTTEVMGENDYNTYTTGDNTADSVYYE